MSTRCAHAEKLTLAQAARFWAKVRHSEDPRACWEWTASKTRGYGRFGIRAGVVRFAHRIAYEQMVGPIPTHLVIDHLCRNPGCVNPAHLEPVTDAENLRRRPVINTNTSAAVVKAAALKSARTHCKFGHELTGANLYATPSATGVWRACNTCRRARSRAFNENNRERQRAQRKARRLHAATATQSPNPVSGLLNASG